MDLLLASTSVVRGTMLANAGVAYGVVAPEVDEDAVKAGFAGDDAALAGMLAGAKAAAVSRGRPGALVIGGDSVLSVEGRRFSKPCGRAEASEHLRAFSGRTMVLTSAVALARGGLVEWRHAEKARLSVRELSEGFIEEYLEAEWPEVGYCVGVFRLEGRGVQLFERIEGDYFSVLGMPLVALLGALRARGVKV